MKHTNTRLWATPCRFKTHSLTHHKPTSIHHCPVINQRQGVTAMRLHIELDIPAGYVADDVGRFYRRLGLATHYSGAVLRVASTDRAAIRSTRHGIVVRMHPRLYKKHRKALEKAESVRNSENPSVQSHPVRRGKYLTIRDILGNPLLLRRKGQRGLRVGILTSGGDAPGMNAVLESVILAAVKHGVRLYGIYRGFQGLIAADIRQLDWRAALRRSNAGGTQLLSVRCAEFLTRDGRKAAVRTLLKYQINALIVVGGDGSLTGALKLADEYPTLVSEILQGCPAQNGVISAHIQNKKDLPDSEDNNKILKKANNPTDCTDKPANNTTSQSTHRNNSDKSHPSQNRKQSPKISPILRIVGIPGTIDNDFPAPAGHATTTTLGSDTALHRILEVLDRVSTTMRSHRRIFVLECMGRTCGWLTMMGAYAANADYILLPEKPVLNWRTDLARTITTAFYNHKQAITVFIGEGAVDIAGHKITLENVRDVVRTALQDSTTATAETANARADSTNLKSSGAKNNNLKKEEASNTHSQVIAPLPAPHATAEGTVNATRASISEFNNRADELNTTGEPLHLSVRTFKIGHLQRGGLPSAYDRLYGYLAGKRAVEYLLGAATEPIYLGFSSGRLQEVSLRDMIAETERQHAAAKNNAYEVMYNSREAFFHRVHACFERHRQLKLKRFYKVGQGMRDSKLSSVEGYTIQQGRESTESETTAASSLSSRTTSQFQSNEEHGKNEIVKSHLNSSNKNQESQTQKVKEEITQVNANNFIKPPPNQGSPTNSLSGCINHQPTLKKARRIAIAYNGPLAPGANACINMLVQHGLGLGYEVLYFTNGFDNLSTAAPSSSTELPHFLKRAFLFEFSTESGRAGVATGRSVRVPPVSAIKRVVGAHGISSLIVIGARDNLQILEAIPGTVLILATNGGIGEDTGLNSIAEAADASLLECSSLRRAVALVEVEGSWDSRLGQAGGIAAGALGVLGGAETSLEAVCGMRDRLSDCLYRGNRDAIFLVGAESFGGGGARVVQSILASECRCTAVVSKVQPYSSSLYTSPRDRIIGGLMAMEALDAVERGAGSGVVGFENDEAYFHPIG